MVNDEPTRFERRWVQGIEQLAIYRGLARKEEPSVKELAFLATTAAMQGFDDFPRFEARLRAYHRADLDRFVAEQAAVWQAVRAIPGFAEALRDPRLAGSLYAVDKPYFAAGATHPEKLLIIFTTVFNNFHLSNLALFTLLKPLGMSILFLKDSSQFNYLNGISAMGGDLSASTTLLKGIIARRGVRQVYVTGFSSSGYPSLLMSVLLPCDGYLGFSIRSDLSVGSKLSPGILFTNDIRAQIPASLCQNLAARLDAGGAVIPRRIIFGSDDDVDRGHADNIAGCPGVSLRELPGCGHPTVARLFADGELYGEFRTLIFQPGDEVG